MFVLFFLMWYNVFFKNTFSMFLSTAPVSRQEAGKIWRTIKEITEREKRVLRDLKNTWTIQLSYTGLMEHVHNAI